MKSHSLQSSPLCMKKTNNDNIMVFIWCFLPSFSSPYKVRNGQLLLGLPALTIMFWSMPGTGHCARFTACSENLAHPNSSQVPHWAQWPVPGKFHYYINVFLIIQTEYCAKQQGHKKTKVHTHSLSLSLSPSLEDQQEVQTKLLPANCNPIIISPCFLRKLVLC